MTNSKATKRERATPPPVSNFSEEHEGMYEVGDVSIVDLPNKMQRFIHLYVTGMYTLKAIGELLDVTPTTVGSWLKNEKVRLIINSMQESTHDIVNAQLKAMSLKAMTKLNELIDSPIDGVALQAVKDVLDRGGHKPRQEIKVDKTVTTIEQRLSELIDDVLDGEIVQIGEDDKRAVILLEDKE